jgi:hypothetical protein
MRTEGRRGGPLEAAPATCPEQGPHMSRKSPLRFVVAAVLVFGLLLPSVAAARGPARETASHAGWGLPGSLWDLLLQVLGPAPWKNRWTIDPDGLKNRSQIDPNGTTVAPDPGPSQSDNCGTIDPNG